jgi:hypothetical protein
MLCSVDRRKVGPIDFPPFSKALSCVKARLRQLLPYDRLQQVGLPCDIRIGWDSIVHTISVFFSKLPRAPFWIRVAPHFADRSNYIYARKRMVGFPLEDLASNSGD